MRDPWVRLHIGFRDYMRCVDGLVVNVAVLPARSLMTRADDGRMELVGWGWEAGIGRGRNGRWYSWSYARSDANEIATRLSERSTP